MCFISVLFMFSGSIRLPIGGSIRVLIDSMVKKYNLANTEQTSLEKGLRSAVASQHLEDVKFFTQHVQNINAQDTNPISRKTALHYAVSKNNIACLKLLLDAGASPEILDVQGLTAAQYAQQGSNAEIQQLIQGQFNKQQLDLTNQEAGERGRQNQAINTTEGACFSRFSVSGDGDCGYTAFGITREYAFKLIRDKLPAVIEILKPVIQEQLLMQNFIDYLEQHKQASTALMQAFARYQTAAQQGGEINAEIMEQLQRHASDLVVGDGYITYDICDKKIDAGWSHPCVLQALARLRQIELYIWKKSSEGQLIPHEYYLHYRSPNLTSTIQRTDLLFINGNHFEKLRLIRQEDIPKNVASPIHDMYGPSAAYSISQRTRPLELASSTTHLQVTSASSSTLTPILHGHRSSKRKEREWEMDQQPEETSSSSSLAIADTSKKLSLSGSQN